MVHGNDDVEIAAVTRQGEEGVGWKWPFHVKALRSGRMDGRKNLLFLFLSKESFLSAMGLRPRTAILGRSIPKKFFNPSSAILILQERDLR